MTRAERDHLAELLERIRLRHSHNACGRERLLREAATCEDAREALSLIRPRSIPRNRKGAR